MQPQGANEARCNATPATAAMPGTAADAPPCLRTTRSRELHTSPRSAIATLDSGTSFFRDVYLFENNARLRTLNLATLRAARRRRAKSPTKPTQAGCETPCRRPPAGAAIVIGIAQETASHGRQNPSWPTLAARSAARDATTRKRWPPRPPSPRSRSRATRR